MKSRFIFVVATIFAAAGISHAVDKNFNFGSKGGYSPSKTTVPYAKYVRQGYGLLMWESNQMTLGKTAVDNSNIPFDPGCGIGIGAEYPGGSCNEHLFGAGPWIAAIIEDTVHNTFRRTCRQGYDGDAGVSEILPNIQDTARDRIWNTSVDDTAFDAGRAGYYKRPMNRRGIDDDGDGRIDEDELDGLDNDHDWVRATDDIGADGVPDSLEVGCKGGYDPVKNPDPAFDDYSGLGFDSCHQRSDGSYPRMNDKNKYTENNGIPDHGEPHVDEDYGAVSDNDFYASATDTFKTPVFDRPSLGIKVFYKSYAFRTQNENENALLPFEYYFVNVGHNKLDSVYVGFFADMDNGPVNVSAYYTHNYACYNDTVRTAYIHNPVDRGSTPLGVTVLAAPKPLAQVEKYIFQWWNVGGGPGASDSIQYAWMSGEAFPNALVENCQPIQQLSDTRFLFSFGPFGPLRPGDTLHIAIAFVAGYCIESCPGNMIDNAQTAIKLYDRGWYQSVTPPSPYVRITPGFKKVTIEWGHHLRPDLPDPMQTWDDSNHIAAADPLRRSNPPHPGEPGGRIFEGFRLYRSEDPGGVLSTFTLLKQYDVIDHYPGENVGSYNVGIDTVYVDTPLVRGKDYYYAVTAYGIPDLSVIDLPDPAHPGTFVHDTIFTASPESPLDSKYNQHIILPFSVSDHVGDVLAVPNPYRVDENYTFENGGWEGRASTWNETKRLIKFIHLPVQCTIRIFSLAGDLVSTIYHDNPSGGEESWNLLSQSNRAIASGVYIFTVESSQGRQIGKFVVIR